LRSRTSDKTPGRQDPAHGQPGCGKTTVLIRIAELLNEKRIAGFTTREIRSGGERTGFSIRTFGGVEGVLSSVRFASGPRVGRYRVDVAGFEKIVLPELVRPAVEIDLFLIDEIGKMECFSKGFVEAVGKILDSRTPLAATVALRGGGFIAETKARSDVEIIEVTRANRDALPGEIADRL